MTMITDKLKEYAPKVVSYVAVLVVGAAVGWQMKPTQVETKETVKVVTVEKQVVVEHETVRVEVVRVKDTQVVDRTRTETTETKLPDGTTTKKVTEEKNIDSVIHDNTNSTQVKVVTVEKQIVVEKEVFKEKIVTLEPNKWHMGLLVGVAPRFDNPAATPLMLGLEVEHRFIGPVFLGGWVMAGSPVVGGFNVTNAAVGLKVGLSF